jgi:hypothetical protein
VEDWRCVERTVWVPFTKYLEMRKCVASLLFLCAICTRRNTRPQRLPRIWSGGTGEPGGGWYCKTLRMVEERVEIYLGVDSTVGCSTRGRDFDGG